MANSLSLLGAGKSGAAAAAAGGYDEPSVTSGLIVKLDAADPNSFDSEAATIWTNTVDDVEATLNNGPVFDEADSIKSISFDGSNDNMYLIRNNADLVDGWTVVLWVNPASLSSDSYDNQGWIIGFSHGYNPQLGITASWCSGPLSGLAAYGYGVGEKSWCDSRIVIDDWHQLVFRNNDGGSMDGWVNGTKNATSVTGFSSNAPGDNFVLPGEGAYGSMDIKIAQVLIYDRPLSDAEVTSLWDGDKERFGLS